MRKLTILVILLAAIATASAITYGPFPVDSQADPVWWNEFGYVLAEEGHLIEAQDAFLQAVLLDPTYENARKNLAVTAFKNEDYLTAIKHWAKLVQEHDTAQYHFDYAQSLVAQARYADTEGSVALARLELALEHLYAAGDYPHAAENAAIVERVIAKVA